MIATASVGFDPPRFSARVFFLAEGWHNRIMDKIDIDPAVTRYVVPLVVAASVAGILAAQELEEAGAAWSWRHVTIAIGAGMVLVWGFRGISDAAGLPAAWDAPMGVVAGSLGIRGLSIGAKWLRGRLESVLSAVLNRATGIKSDGSRDGGSDAQS